MKHFLLTLLLLTSSFASITTINSFEADFVQSITDEKNKVLTYSGHITAMKPQYAKWNYTSPVLKDVYINDFKVTIVEPEIEQVIIKKLESNFEFFKMIQNAKKVSQNTYEANYKKSKFTIKEINNIIQSISYIDEFENNVKVAFKNQKQNQDLQLRVFAPHFPLYYDIIRD
ncbi:LolA-like outer membrane lipoprotein chaperone [Sulfurimonas sp.]|nr:LolA-like outer membrane lipoprotein chaperone [Sulfurimonas sp.]